MNKNSGPRVFLLGSFAPSVVRFRLPLIDKILALGGEVSVGAPVAEFSADDLEILRQRAVKVYDLPVARHGLNPITELAYMLRVRNALKQSRPDFLIPYTVKPVVFGTFAARLAGVPKTLPIVTGLGSVFIGEPKNAAARFTRYLVTRLYRSAFSRCEHLYFQNGDDPRDLRACGALPESSRWSILAGSGVDIDQFGAVPLPNGSHGLNFLMISRLIADKGVREFAEAARIVKSRHASVRFRLVGPLDTNPSAIKQEELDQWTWIEHRPWLDDVRPEIAACAVYVLPSYREGTPRSVLEAMACGRAVITTDAPGCRETVKDGDNGYLVKVKDADSLAEAMERFVNDPDLAGRMGLRGREIAVARYDATKVYDVMLQRIGLLPPAPGLVNENLAA